jgi:hypothetical protein
MYQAPVAHTREIFQNFVPISVCPHTTFPTSIPQCAVPTGGFAPLANVFTGASRFRPMALQLPRDLYATTTKVCRPFPASLRVSILLLTPAVCVRLLQMQHAHLLTNFRDYWDMQHSFEKLARAAPAGKHEEVQFTQSRLIEDVATCMPLINTANTLRFTRMRDVPLALHLSLPRPDEWAPAFHCPTSTVVAYLLDRNTMTFFVSDGQSRVVSAPISCTPAADLLHLHGLFPLPFPSRRSTLLLLPQPLLYADYTSPYNVDLVRPHDIAAHSAWAALPPAYVFATLVVAEDNSATAEIVHRAGRAYTTCADRGHRGGLPPAMYFDERCSFYAALDTSRVVPLGLSQVRAHTPTHPKTTAHASTLHAFLFLPYLALYSTQVLYSIAAPNASLLVSWSALVQTNFPNASPGTHVHAPTLCPSPRAQADYIEAVYTIEPNSLRSPPRFFISSFDPSHPNAKPRKILVTPYEMAAKRYVYIRVIACTYDPAKVPPPLRDAAGLYNGLPSLMHNFPLKTETLTLLAPVTALRHSLDLRPNEVSHRVIFYANTAADSFSSPRN